MIWPQLHPAAERELAEAVVHDFPYAIFYRVYEARTVVMAVAHTGRRPGYWLDRVG